MDLRRVGIVYRKEILEALRDRRTIISTIVIPIILFPVIFVAFGGLAGAMVKSAQAERAKIAIVGAENAPEIATEIRASPAFQIVDASDFRTRIEEKKLRAVVEFPRDFQRR